ncbi:hypothetical protein SSCG_04674 [Streptomyces clavuligerus]|nr:hypothetical protein SSCG_04674 [Streptomyces clavuligerus]
MRGRFTMVPRATCRVAPIREEAAHADRFRSAAQTLDTIGSGA